MDQKTAYKPYNLEDFQFQNIQNINTAQEQKSSTIQKPARHPNSYFSKEEREKDKNKGSTSLITKEMQVKTTMRYYLTLVRMTIIKKGKDNKYWEERKSLYTAGKNVNQFRHYGKQCQGSQKTKKNRFII